MLTVSGHVPDEIKWDEIRGDDNEIKNDLHDFRFEINLFYKIKKILKTIELSASKFLICEVVVNDK